MIQQLRNVNFGRSHADLTGSSGVGYSILDYSGSIVTPRTTTGVYQLMSGSGLYAAYIDFSDGFRGQIMWDCPAFSGSGGSFQQTYATEGYNVEENDPKVAQTYDAVNSVTGTIQSIHDMNYGRWKLDKTSNQMLFYAPDNVTLIATFNLFDDAGNPVFDGVFERRSV